MLRPHNTSVVPKLLLLCPIEAHYCHYCAFNLLLLCRPQLYFDPRSENGALSLLV